MTLHEIGEDFAEIDRMIEDCWGEITPEIQEKLDRLELAESDKIDGLVRYISHLESCEEAARDEAATYAAKAAAAAKRVEWLKRYALSHLAKRGLSEVKTRLHRIALRKAGGPLALDVEIGALPPEYLRTKTETVPDKDKIRAELEQGHVIPGACFKERQLVVSIS